MKHKYFREKQSLLSQDKVHNHFECKHKDIIKHSSFLEFPNFRF